MYLAYIKSVKLKYISKKHHLPDEKYKERMAIATTLLMIQKFPVSYCLDLA